MARSATGLSSVDALERVDVNLIDAAFRGGEEQPARGVEGEVAEVGPHGDAQGERFERAHAVEMYLAREPITDHQQISGLVENHRAWCVVQRDMSRLGQGVTIDDADPIEEQVGEEQLGGPRRPHEVAPTEQLLGPSNEPNVQNGFPRCVRDASGSASP